MSQDPLRKIEEALVKRVSGSLDGLDKVIIVKKIRAWLKDNIEHIDDPSSIDLQELIEYIQRSPM